MKPETLAEVWRLARAWAMRPASEANDARAAINAILSRHVEQPSETEEQAAERIRQAERDEALRAIEALSRDPDRSIGEQRRLDDLRARIQKGDLP